MISEKFSGVSIQTTEEVMEVVSQLRCSTATGKDVMVAWSEDIVAEVQDMIVLEPRGWMALYLCQTGHFKHEGCKFSCIHPTGTQFYFYL